jgi:dipeptidyl aminopeptidase/acylaminoacyl peptidase
VSLAGRVDTLRTSDIRVLGADWVSAPEPVRFTSAGGRESHAVLYRPRNPGATPSPDDELPPLLVVLHGGPTSQGETALSPEIQYWTTRGFAVADVDYTGSTGYGREYRRALYGQWGVADVEDCLAVVRHLADAGIVDGRRAAIRGGSAGGFTTLAALTHSENTFATGASYYGIADLEVLAGDTHKFESRYCDQLIGPLPEAAATYRERSPIAHVDRLRVPLAVFQGAEDAVVPPAQSRMIVDAVRAKRQPCVYLEFPGEQHGFRQTDSLIRSIETELWFYGRVFGFDPPVSIDPPADAGF